MKKVLFSILCCIFLISCNQNTSNSENKDGNSDLDNIEAVNTTFFGKSFKDPVHVDILKELNICELTTSDTSYYATCTPDNFQLLSFKEEVDIKDAFILQIKSTVRLKGQDELLPLRHILLFERENGSLVKVNGFRGELVGVKSNTKTRVKDIIIALYDNEDETLFHCLFVWNGSKYSFDSVISLDYGDGNRTIKKGHKEKISRDVYQKMIANSKIF